MSTNCKVRSHGVNIRDAPMDRSVSASHSSSRSRASNMPCSLRTSASLCAMRSEMNWRIVAMYAGVHSDVNLRVASARSTYSITSKGNRPRVDLDATACKIFSGYGKMGGQEVDIRKHGATPARTPRAERRPLSTQDPNRRRHNGTGRHHLQSSGRINHIEWSNLQEPVIKFQRLNSPTIKRF